MTGWKSVDNTPSPSCGSAWWCRLPNPMTQQMQDNPDFPFDLVMFDLDGTLLATAAELCDAVNDSLGTLGLAGVSEGAVSGWIGNGTRELLVQALAEVSSQPAERVRGSDLLQRAVSAFDPSYENRCGTNSWLYPHVDAVLRQLQARGIHLAVVTNKDSRFTGRLLDFHRLMPMLGLVVAGDTMAAKKPAPDGILHCLAHFRVPAERALFVGDSSIDIATARNAGVRVWALPGGYNLGQPIGASGPDRVIDDLSALVAAG